MRKRLVIVVAALATIAGVPAAAGEPYPGGVKGSCGIGPEGAHETIADTASGPGASEAGTFSPLDAGCTGPRPGQP